MRCRLKYYSQNFITTQGPNHRYLWKLDCKWVLTHREFYPFFYQSVTEMFANDELNWSLPMAKNMLTPPHMAPYSIK